MRSSSVIRVRIGVSEVIDSMHIKPPLGLWTTVKKFRIADCKRFSVVSKNKNGASGYCTHCCHIKVRVDVEIIHLLISYVVV